MHKIPIGIEFYKRMIDNDYYFVDKTLLIKDLIDNGAYVSLFTRPRRFGKTLALSMIQTFFEIDMDQNGNINDNTSYFDGMKIMHEGDKYISHLGQYPVITLSLKSGKQPTFEMAHQSLIDEIIKEYDRHTYVLSGNKLSLAKKEQYQMILERKAAIVTYSKALAFLSECLMQYHNKKVIILIDEYDVPLENAYFCGFYNDIIGFVRSLFESALKTNPNLEFAVVTGCLRISKESIFTGLNNLEIVSILNHNFSEHFGFTQNEVAALLDYYGIGDKLDDVTKWYNGYVFGKTQVYNPWSIINYTKALHIEPTAFPKPYWANTSSNSIVRELIENADDATKSDIENLISGGSIEVKIHEDITYDDIHKTKDNLWNFLFFTGYLKAIKQRLEFDSIYMTLQIPNMEIRYIYRNTILDWFENNIVKKDLSELVNAIQSGECEKIEDFISNELIETISFFDYAENYYHGFLCGLLKAGNGFNILSNRESGNGRPDIIMKTRSVRGMAIIIEIKTVKNFDDMENGCLEALEQINTQNYSEELYKEGYRKILKYGFCFYKKECMVRMSLS